MSIRDSLSPTSVCSLSSRLDSDEEECNLLSTQSEWIVARNAILVAFTMAVESTSKAHLRSPSHTNHYFRISPFTACVDTRNQLAKTNLRGIADPQTCAGNTEPATRVTKMLPHDQRRVGGADGRRRAARSPDECGRLEEGAGRSRQTVSKQAGGDGQVEGKLVSFCGQRGTVD